MLDSRIAPLAHSTTATRWSEEDTVKIGTMYGVWAKSGHIGVGSDICSPIGSPQSPLEYVYIGDNVFVGEGCNIQVPRLVVGDYTKIHRNGLIYGRNPLRIGYNCWFGENTIIDCEGKVTIGNGVGAGAYSQLWSHIRHGDVVEGCRYLSFSELRIEDDAWFVGHCVVSPIHAQSKSMALVGSVVTHNMQSNHVYGGAPAKDLTDKLGQPFQARGLGDKFTDMAERLMTFYDRPGEEDTTVCIVDSFQEDLVHMTQFNVATRTYTKKLSPQEIRFMKFLLPEAKFTPEGEGLPL